VALCRERLARFEQRIHLVHAPFSRLRLELDQLGVDRVDGLVADLGVSSRQLDGAERGMSFRHEGPLDMRMDPESGRTAAELIEESSDEELTDIIAKLGEERRARRIARCIHQALEAGELETTLDLRRAVVRAVGPARVGGIDPATRTFQALRIAVNDELGEIDRLLSAAPRCLKQGATIAVLTFHSLEDRIVKRKLAGPEWRAVGKKPRVPSDAEVDDNPRARSAKLRVATLVEEA
jgi:16S rRNA (cytosine1402-N4)-methyltransferase